MGRGRRPRPRNLNYKLSEIRRRLEITQEEMAKRLIEFGAERTMSSGYVADFETGKREPSLLALLAYTRMVKVTMEALVDDEMELPRKLPGEVKQRG